MEPAILGIDIAKRKFDVALLIADKMTVGKFDNEPTGFAKLERWLEKYGVERVHACLEATGTYGDALAEHLYHAGHVVSLVNPARIKGFGQSELSRTKTDKADAQLIARFCRVMRPEPWQPLAPEVKELQSLVRRLEALNDMLDQERNRLESAEGLVRDSIQRVIAHLQQEIKATRTLIRTHIVGVMSRELFSGQRTQHDLQDRLFSHPQSALHACIDRHALQPGPRRPPLTTQS
jgi:transposase